ncbi:27749_t:CDS:2, partial [Racocetra persica]
DCKIHPYPLPEENKEATNIGKRLTATTIESQGKDEVKIRSEGP